MRFYFDAEVDDPAETDASKADVVRDGQVRTFPLLMMDSAAGRSRDKECSSMKFYNNDTGVSHVRDADALIRDTLQPGDAAKAMMLKADARSNDAFVVEGAIRNLRILSGTYALRAENQGIPLADRAAWKRGADVLDGLTDGAHARLNGMA